ncbi:MAG TPA: alpha/beta hydrolase [Vicinamibacterales bacterium]|nr:alpha/beta hydrolase [Vicinamibacterales bacterium]
MVTLATPATLFRKQLVLPNGVRLNSVQGGAIDGAAVILLHGITDSSYSFSRLLPLLPPELRVIALDLRGHGDSDRPADGYTMDDFAEDVIGVMDVLGIPRATLVGHSMGSFVARRAAERAPERVSRLVLVGTALAARNAVVAELQAAVERLVDPVDESFIREFQLSTLHRPVPPEFLDHVIAESRKLPARVWRAALAGLANYAPQWPITCPATILGGELDAVFSPDEQTALFLATEHSTLHLEREVGHTLHWEAPERFAALAFPES